ncbi:MAG: hypothetical protein RSA12_05900 [Clostridia bacterium]
MTALYEKRGTVNNAPKRAYQIGTKRSLKIAIFRELEFQQRLGDQKMRFSLAVVALANVLYDVCRQRQQAQFGQYFNVSARQEALEAPVVF